MKLLIIGASGVLGSRLYNDAIKRKWNVLGTYFSQECEGLFCLDLKDRKTVDKIFNFFKPEVVVCAGGITDVDLCEKRPRLAREVNVSGTSHLVRKIKEYDAKFVFLSTDYVFDGKDGLYSEEASPCPINIYGKTKLEGEAIIRDSLDDFLIVRTAQLYGVDHRNRNFAVKIIRNMQNNKKVYAADDFYCTPTYVGTLSEAIIKLIKSDKRGIFNVAGSDFLHRYAYISLISDIFSLDKSLIQKLKLKDLHLKAARPRKAGLKIDKLVKEIKIKPLNCKDGLKLLRKEMS